MTSKARTSKLPVSIGGKELDDMIRKIVGERVRVILEEQLGNVVAGEMAKMRLTGKGAPGVAELVNKKLTQMLTHRLNATTIQSLARRRVDEVIGNQANVAVGILRNKFMDAVSERFQW
jgi:hypothetical protein